MCLDLVRRKALKLVELLYLSQILFVFSVPLFRLLYFLNGSATSHTCLGTLCLLFPLHTCLGTLCTIVPTSHVSWNSLSFVPTSHMSWNSLSFVPTSHMFWNSLSFVPTSHMSWNSLSFVRSSRPTHAISGTPLARRRKSPWTIWKAEPTMWWVDDNSFIIKKFSFLFRLYQQTRQPPHVTYAVLYDITRVAMLVK